MIKVTRLNGQLIVLNAELIEFVEEIPDTIISLTTGKKIMVKENAEEIIDKVISYKRSSGSVVQRTPLPTED
jgi:flagellar protein FlbD